MKFKDRVAHVTAKVESAKKMSPLEKGRKREDLIIDGLKKLAKKFGFDLMKTPMIDARGNISFYIKQDKGSDDVKRFPKKLVALMNKVGKASNDRNLKFVHDMNNGVEANHFAWEALLLDVGINKRELEALKTASVEGTEVTAAFRMTPKDQKVIDCFLDKKACDGTKLTTDGECLDGMWVGGKGIACWKGGKIEMPDLGSKAVQTVQTAIRKKAPKNQIAASVTEAATDKGKAFEILDSLAEDAKTEDPKKMALDWMAGAFTSKLSGMMDIAVGEAAKLVKEWAKGKSASVVEAASSDQYKIKVDKDDTVDDIQNKMASMFSAALNRTIRRVLLANGADASMAGKVKRYAERAVGKLAIDAAEEAKSTGIYDDILKK